MGHLEVTPWLQVLFRGRGKMKEAEESPQSSTSGLGFMMCSPAKMQSSDTNWGLTP